MSFNCQDLVKIVVLWEEGFPCIDTAAVTREHLQVDASDRFRLEFVGTGALDAALQDAAALVTPYGSAFPKAAWPAMRAYLEQGGSWVNLGGSPLSRPVRRNADGSWYVEVPQTAYGKQLFINHAFPIQLEEHGIFLDAADREVEDPEPWEWTDALKRAVPDLPAPRISRAWSLQVRFTDTKDFAAEHGSSGSRDAAMRPQCYALFEGRRLAAPIVVIDRLRGPYAGGCWVLVNAELTEPFAPILLRALLQQAVQGPIEFEIRPNYACYYEGERPDFTLRACTARLQGEYKVEVTIHSDSSFSEGEQVCFTLSPGVPVFRRTTPGIHAGNRKQSRRTTLDIHDQTGPGLYTVRAALRHATTQEVMAESETGFWRYDEALLSSARPLTLNRDYFERDGEPYPVMGTTYMAGDTHRKFLFEPNCAVWDRDFAAMKAAGVNMVRTGLWTAYRSVMLDPGVVDEGVLRAFTAFLLTARKYGIPVIFTFFAFLPEAWNGSNPYLDPRAMEAQKELVAAFAQRFAMVNDLIWDLINEPSFSSPSRIWSTRPNYDQWERGAWTQWLRERAQTFAAEESQAANAEDVWRERWRLTPDMPLDLPALADFQDQYIFQGTHPLRVLDYRLFAQEMFNRWVSDLSAVIRSSNPRQLITVGQDEGGTGDRPNPHFYADVVDFTSNHTWWQNDDLLWDAVMTKTPHKPNLIEETGIMFVENVDGSYRRSPQEAANLLARKLVLAFAAGCAGVIQWLWNTNVYMDSDNEVGIGFLRADGTEKPELQVFREIAQLMWEHRRRMVGRELEEVVIVIPHSNMFSVRNLADQATRRAVRALDIELGVPTRTVSEYRIEAIGDPKLIVLPSARVLTQSCWEALLAKVEQGATLLVTGPIDSDEYWRDLPRIHLLDIGLETEIRPVTPHDDFGIEAYPWYPLFFRGDAIQKVDKAVLSGERIERSMDTKPDPDNPDAGIPISPEQQMEWRLFDIPYGKGKVLYFRFPIELTASGSDALYLLYQEACRRAGIEFEEDAKLGRDGFTVRQMKFRDTIYYLVVGETGSSGGTHLKCGDDYVNFLVYDGDDAGIVIVDRSSGQVLAEYP